MVSPARTPPIRMHIWSKGYDGTREPRILEWGHRKLGEAGKAVQETDRMARLAIGRVVEVTGAHLRSRSVVSKGSGRPTAALLLTEKER